MKQLHATYSITTPMFLGGADQQVTGLRTPSFKGALRFWWRALMWGELEGDDAAAKLRELHAQEARLFGTAANDDDSAQSRVLLSIDSAAEPRTSSVEDILRLLPRGSTGSGVQYLLGQGIKGRKAISPGFKVEVTFRHGVDEAERGQVERALLAFGLLGGLGSRARRGFGSCTLSSITGDRCLAPPALEPPTTIDQLRACLRRVVGSASGGEPEISAFSDASLVEVSLAGRDALSVLDRAGQAQSKFRQTLTADTAKAIDVMKRVRPQQPPARISFGLPLQFYFKDEETTVFFEVQPPDDHAKRDRRASPLFLHVHHLTGEAENRFALVQTFLPSRFLPRADQVRARSRPGTSYSLGHASASWTPVHNYLGSFEGSRRVFP